MGLCKRTCLAATAGLLFVSLLSLIRPDNSTDEADIADSLGVRQVSSLIDQTDDIGLVSRWRTDLFPTIGNCDHEDDPAGLFTLYTGSTLRQGEFTFSIAYSNRNGDAENDQQYFYWLSASDGNPVPTIWSTSDDFLVRTDSQLRGMGLVIISNRLSLKPFSFTSTFSSSTFHIALPADDLVTGGQVQPSFGTLANNGMEHPHFDLPARNAKHQFEVRSEITNSVSSSTQTSDLGFGAIGPSPSLKPSTFSQVAFCGFGWPETVGQSFPAGKALMAPPSQVDGTSFKKDQWIETMSQILG